MEFLKELYLEEDSKIQPAEILKKISANKRIPNLYLIAISTCLDNMLDIIPEWEVLQKGYPKKNLRIVGLAEGKWEAFHLVQLIIEESLKMTGSADVRAYLKQKWEENE